MRSPLRLLLPTLLAGLLAVGCAHRIGEAVAPVTVGVVVVDGNGYPWEGVEVHIVEAWTEWSDCLCKGKRPWIFEETDEYGEVTFDSAELAYADLGFRERYGVAVVGEYADNNEAVVRLLVGHDTLGWVQVDVPLSFHDPKSELFVEIDP